MFTPRWYGADVTGDADAVPGVRAAIAAAHSEYLATGQGQTVHFTPGLYRFASYTGSGGTASAVVIPPGVSVVGEGSHAVTVVIDAPANAFAASADLGTELVVTGDVPFGATTLPVADSTGFDVGSLVVLNLAQNPSDPAESRQVTYAKVTATTATTITVDVPAEWAFTVAGTLPIHRRIRQVIRPLDGLRVGGFRFVGTPATRHAVQVMYGRGAELWDLRGTDVGSGLINSQFTTGLNARGLSVDGCRSFENTSKGRAVSLSNVRNATIANLTVEGLAAAAVYVESYCQGVTVNGLHITNNAPLRQTQYLTYAGLGCDLTIDGLVFTGSPSDSVMSSDPTGRGFIRNATLYMDLASVRTFPLGRTTGFLRYLSGGQMLTFNMDRAERSQVKIPLADGTTNQYDYLRDGLLAAIEVFVTDGVPPGALTMRVGRTGVQSTPLPWTPGMTVRTTSGGGSVYPHANRHDQPVKITTATTEGIPAGAYALVTATTIPHDTQTSPGP